MEKQATMPPAPGHLHRNIYPKHSIVYHRVLSIIIPFKIIISNNLSAYPGGTPSYIGLVVVFSQCIRPVRRGLTPVCPKISGLLF